MAQQRRARDEDKEKFYRSAIRRWKESGLSRKAFCLKEGLNPNTFDYWRKEIQRRDAEVEAGRKPVAKKAPLPTKTPFVPVIIQSDVVQDQHTTERGVIEIRGANDLVLTLPADSPASVIRLVIDSVWRASC